MQRLSIMIEQANRSHKEYVELRNQEKEEEKKREE
jgi:hypothetical protein